MSLKNPGQRYIIKDSNGNLVNALIGTKNSKEVKRAKKSNYDIQIVESFGESELRLIFKEFIVDDRPNEILIDKYSLHYIDNTCRYNADEINLIQEITKIYPDDVYNSETFRIKLSVTHKILQGLFKEAETFDEYFESSKSIFHKTLIEKGIRLTNR